MTPEQMQAWRWEKEMDDRNRPMNDDELDAIFPQDGYKVGLKGGGQEGKRRWELRGMGWREAGKSEYGGIWGGGDLKG
jgi:hypothetical protein